MSVAHKIAVVYGYSGMGDVGKYALKHALKAPGVTVKAIAMASRATAEPDFDADADVQPEALQLELKDCLLYTSPSPRDQRGSRMPSSA